MVAVFTTLSIGILISILGIINITGNISSLHWYHRQRVTEADRKPFGRLVGTGTLLCGLSCIWFSGWLLPTLATDRSVFAVIGSIGLCIGLGAGLVISLYAIQKYNKGIF